MSEGVLNELYELVVSVCDNLYAGRQLITKAAVKKALALHGDWSEQELELLLPKYINDWRLHNLVKDNDLAMDDKVFYLETQVCKYKSDLHNANIAINKLKTDLVAMTLFAKQQRKEIIQTLRGLLSA